jgi:hypothetical protein
MIPQRQAVSLLVSDVKTPFNPFKTFKPFKPWRESALPFLEKIRNASISSA